MIKALFLVFDPAATWDRISLTPRRWASVVAGYLLPMLIMTSAVEGLGLFYWGKPRRIVGVVETLTLTQTITYELLQFLLTLVMVFFAAKVIKSMGDTFHGQHTTDQTTTVVVYGLSPLFMLRMVNAIPAVSPWIGWVLGMLLASAILYHGIPRIMKPDPPHAFGLFLTSSILLILVSGIVRFVTWWYLLGKFTRLDDLVARLVGH